MLIGFNDLPRFALGTTIQLGAAVYIGEGKLYFIGLPFTDYEQLKHTPIDIVAMSVDDWNEFLRRVDSQEVEVSDGIEKAIISKSQRQIDQVTMWNCYRRDGYRCCYCGKNDVPLTVDHLVLWEDGGPTIEQNLLTSCQRCNRTRGNKQYADWLNDPYYLSVFEGLTMERKLANTKLVQTLSRIPKLSRIKSR